MSESLFSMSVVSMLPSEQDHQSHLSLPDGVVIFVFLFLTGFLCITGLSSIQRSPALDHALLLPWLRRPLLCRAALNGSRLCPALSRNLLGSVPVSRHSSAGGPAAGSGRKPTRACYMSAVGTGEAGQGDLSTSAPAAALGTLCTATSSTVPRPMTALPPQSNPFSTSSAGRPNPGAHRGHLSPLCRANRKCAHSIEQ